MTSFVRHVNVGFGVVPDDLGSCSPAAAFPDAAMLHALRFTVWRVVQGNAVTMAVGPGQGWSSSRNRCH